MNIQNKKVLITGANRGIGRALLDEGLRRGAKKVYAGTRGTFQHTDERVSPLTLDVTNASQIQRAVNEVGTLDILINNAGIAVYDDLSNLDVLEQTFAVNFLSLLKVTNAFLPLLKRSKGAVVLDVATAMNAVSFFRLFRHLLLSERRTGFTVIADALPRERWILAAGVLFVIFGGLFPNATVIKRSLRLILCRPCTPQRMSPSAGPKRSKDDEGAMNRDPLAA